MSRPEVVAVDFDGTLVDGGLCRGGVPLVWRRGAREFLLALLGTEVRVVLHSRRSSPDRGVMPGDAEDFYATGRAPADAEFQWALMAEMRGFLQAAGLWGFLRVWEGPGKPAADRFVDDLAGGPPDFVQVAAELGVRLVVA